MRGTGRVVFAATLLVIVGTPNIRYGDDEAVLGGEDERALGA